MTIIGNTLNTPNNERQQINNPAAFSVDLVKDQHNPDDFIIDFVATAKQMADIDWSHLGELGYISPGDSNTLAVEEYRNIKRPLVGNAFGKGSEGIARANLILITSSLPGEGKTFTAINLALSIANERDKQVLLIDADVARPSISRVLGIKSEPGLIDFLDRDDLSFSDIILSTSMPGLCIVPSGSLHRHSTELLASNKMSRLIEELSKNPNTLVIFDSPPLMAATQGQILAKLVGQVVLVVEAEKTLQSVVMESVEKLSACDVVLAVFNKSNVIVDGNYYGYGYGYGQYGP
ncbi:MAG: XrtA-associated tyrosine autokinase [Methylococcales bacterium]|nr:XrtA-associated tyrosine autokinase [Methylococcales bacterium]